MKKENTPITHSDKARYGFMLFLFTTIITSVDFIVNMLRSVVRYDMDITSWLYYLPAAIGHAALIALMLYLVVYLPLSYAFKNYKVATIAFVICAILMQAIIIIDGFVFNLYRFHINGFVIELVFGAGSDIFIFDIGVILKFCLLVFMFAVIPYSLAVYISRRTYKALRKKQCVWISTALFLCLFISHVGHALAAANKQASIQSSATVMPLFFPLTANSLLTKIGLANNDEIDNLDYNRPSAAIRYPLEVLQKGDSIPNYNILYIVVDSWNPSTLDSVTTPNIHRFAKKGHTFDSHMSSSNGTRGSIFGMFFGVSYTYEKDFIVSKTSPLMIDQLIDHNYSIQTFPSANFTTPPFHETIFRRVPAINTRAEGKTVFDRDNKITEMAMEHILQRDATTALFSFRLNSQNWR